MSPASRPATIWKSPYCSLAQDRHRGPGSTAMRSRDPREDGGTATPEPVQYEYGTVTSNQTILPSRPSTTPTSPAPTRSCRRRAARSSGPARRAARGTRPVRRAPSSATTGPTRAASKSWISHRMRSKTSTQDGIPPSTDYSAVGNTVIFPLTFSQGGDGCGSAPVMQVDALLQRGAVHTCGRRGHLHRTRRRRGAADRAAVGRRPWLRQRHGHALPDLRRHRRQCSGQLYGRPGGPGNRGRVESGGWEVRLHPNRRLSDRDRLQWRRRVFVRRQYRGLSTRLLRADARHGGRRHDATVDLHGCVARRTRRRPLRAAVRVGEVLRDATELPQGTAGEFRRMGRRTIST